MFSVDEQPRLLPAPVERYDLPIYVTAKVHRDHHIEVAKALYSVPGNLIGSRVDVRADRALVRIFAGGRLVKQPTGTNMTAGYTEVPSWFIDLPRSDPHVRTARAGLAQSVVPGDVVAIDTRSQRIEARLYPAERRAMSGRAVPARVREYELGRGCAHQALVTLGEVQPGPVLRGADREPIWPDGATGSISHCPGLVAAAVGRSATYQSIGLDVEVARALPLDALALVASLAERDHLSLISGACPVADRVLFSAKEAIYKAWFPITGQWLGLEDVELRIDAKSNSFRGRLLIPRTRWFDSAGELTGRFTVTDGFVVTAVTCRRSRGG